LTARDGTRKLNDSKQWQHCSQQRETQDVGGVYGETESAVIKKWKQLKQQQQQQQQ
jgi:hypothetical protein